MTDVSNKEKALIHSFADAKELYAPSPVAETGKVGIEVEMHVFRRGEAGPLMIPPSEMMALQNQLKEKGHNAQLEAASVLEYASPAFSDKEIPQLSEVVASHLQEFKAVVAEQGMETASLPVMPTMTMQDALSQMIDRERLRIGINSLVDISPHGAGAIALLTAGVQVSFSPRDKDQLFRMAYRAYALTPLLYSAFNASSGFAENEPGQKDYHIRAAYYEGYGAAGGMAESFLQASDADAYINNHIAQVFTTPMYFAYGEETILPSTREKVLTFEGLPKELQTRSNYELAESFLYHDVKICNLRDEGGEVIGKRLEVRAVDASHQNVLMAPLLIGALVPEGRTAECFDLLLKEYGFTGNPVVDAPLFRAARNEAVHHKGRFMNVAFGVAPEKGRQRTLKSFAADVACLVEDHYAKATLNDVTHQHLLGLTDLLKTGRTQAEEYAAKYPSFVQFVRSLSKAEKRPASVVKQSPNKGGAIYG